MNYEKELKKALISDDRILLEKVFEEIYNEYHNLIIYIVSKYINNELDIEEILNDVFFYFFKNIFKTEMTNIKYYLVQSAKNLTINHLKKLSPLIDFLDDKHRYEKIIFESYIENNDFFLTEEQRLKAYLEYQKWKQGR